MRLCQLQEDKLPQKLPVILEPTIYYEIENVENNNKDNEDAISQWKRSLSTIVNHLSNPVIAWDYNRRFKHRANGAVYANIFGHDIAYTIDTSVDGKNCVVVFYFELNPDSYGLNEGRHMKNSLLISESRLRKIIAESIRKALYN